MLRFFALLCAIAIMALPCVCFHGPPHPEPSKPERIFQFHPRSWYGDKLGANAAVSPNASFVAFEQEGRLFLANLATNTRTDLLEKTGFKGIRQWFWTADNLLDFSGPGEKGLERILLDPNDFSTKPSPTPKPAIQTVTSQDGKATAGFWRRKAGDKQESGVFLFPSDGREPVLVVPNLWPHALAVSPDKKELAFLTPNQSGWMKLVLADVATKTQRTLAEALDTTYMPQKIGYGPQGKKIYVSLVSGKTGTLADRQKPNSDRFLNLFAIDRETGAISPVIMQDEDDLFIGVAGHRLAWVRSMTDMRVGVIPAKGGQVRPLLEPTTSLPFWSPDGSQLSAMFGRWHTSDWALNWDLGIVSLGKNARTKGAFQPEITGNHEDFGLAWSPDGQWFAYHSHRSENPAYDYMSPGSTDDIWLRKVSGGPEIRLTDFGRETSQPDWAPDSKRLIFCAMSKKTPYQPWIVTIDPESGQPKTVDQFKADGIENPIVGCAWSPTGGDIALEEDLGNHRRRLWLVKEDGKAPRALAEYQALTYLGGLDFSPDGTHLVYAALAEGHHHLFRISREGGAATQLTTGNMEHIYPQYAPDGRHIALTVYRHTKEVWLSGL